LTIREQQLVMLIGKGMTNKEIASQLQLAEQTVRMPRADRRRAARCAICGITAANN